MNSKVICMASAKGGSGKTILTATFATLLVSLGKKVLLIDTDAATNGLTLLYLPEVMRRSEIARAKSIQPSGVYESIQPSGIYEAANGPLPTTPVELSNGAALIPATYSFQNTETVSLDLYMDNLNRVLERARATYDVVFLDAQAGSDPFAAFAMKRGVSDEVVIVSEYDPLSAAGVERLKGFFRDDLTYDRTWILLNKMLPEFVKSFSDFLEVARYLSPIPWTADVVKAYSRRRLALDLQLGNDFTLAVIQTLKSLLGEQIEKEVADWTEKRAQLAWQPLELRYNELSMELEVMRGNYEKKLARARQIRSGSLLAVLYGSAFLWLLPVIERLLGAKAQFLVPVREDFAIALFVTGTLGLSLPVMRNVVKNFLLSFEVSEDDREALDRLRAQVARLENLKAAGLEAIIQERTHLPQRGIPGHRAE